MKRRIHIFKIILPALVLCMAVSCEEKPLPPEIDDPTDPLPVQKEYFTVIDDTVNSSSENLYIEKLDVRIEPLYEDGAFLRNSYKVDFDADRIYDVEFKVYKCTDSTELLPTEGTWMTILNEKMWSLLDTSHDLFAKLSDVGDTLNSKREWSGNMNPNISFSNNGIEKYYSEHNRQIEHGYLGFSSVDTVYFWVRLSVSDFHILDIESICRNKQQ